MQSLKPKCNFFCLMAIILVLSGVWHAYSPLLLERERFSAVMGQAKTVTTMDIARMIVQPGKPTLLYAYASWCENCHRTTPLLATRIRAGFLEDFNLVFVAWDKEKYDLAHYLVREGYDGLWTPYHSETPIGDGLGLYGVADIPGVPYIGVFNAMGQLEKQHLGTFTADQLELMLASVQGEKRPMSVAP